MAKIDRFEDLIAWQKSRALTQSIYVASRSRPFARDFGLADQIKRAAVSVVSNIAEGFERRSRAEFHRFLVTAKASCAEVRSQLYVALDAGYLEQEKFAKLVDQTQEVSRIVG